MKRNTDDQPLYQQVKNAILARIESNELNPGDALPTEAELEEEFKVSRTTIRAAINELQNEGILTKQQGRGTFISANTYEDCQAKLQSFTQDAGKRKIPVKTMLLNLDIIVPNEKIRKEIPGCTDTVLRIQRLRYTEGVPSILTVSFLPRYVYEKMDWENLDFSRVSLYAEMKKAGIDFENGEQVIEVCGASAYEATLLQVEVGWPMCLSRRKVYNAKGQIIEYSYNLTRGDRYRLHIKLKK